MFGHSCGHLQGGENKNTICLHVSNLLHSLKTVWFLAEIHGWIIK
jgi:hypothetical protein